MKRLYNTEEHRQEIKEALNTGSMRLILRAFFFPKMARAFLLRTGILILSAWCFFKFICLPLVIQGESMLPTYPARGFTFCWAPAYWFRSPQRGDVVIMKYGKGVMLLKRVIALPGDTVAFRGGKLIRDLSFNLAFCIPLLAHPSLEAQLSQFPSQLAISFTILFNNFTFVYYINRTIKVCS